MLPSSYSGLARFMSRMKEMPSTGCCGDRRCIAVQTGLGSSPGLNNLDDGALVDAPALHEQEPTDRLAVLSVFCQRPGSRGFGGCAPAGIPARVSPQNRTISSLVKCAINRLRCQSAWESPDR